MLAEYFKTKNRMSRVLPVLLLLLSPVAHAESYLCTAEQLAGFIYNRSVQSWQAAASAADDSFIVRHSSEAGTKNIGPPWFVTERGKDFGIACANDFDAQGFLYCKGLGGDFMMNRKTLRFRHLNDRGYVVEQYTQSSPEGKQSPYMKIGSCEPYK